MARCTRRSFMKGGALAFLALGSAPRFLLRSALAQERTGKPKILIAIFQRGAVDGLSMIVPHGDPDYYAARGGIAIARPAGGGADTTIDLDGFFGLHPALAPLKPLWDGRRLAIVHACGSPDVTRSHFDAQDYMESGTPGVKSTADGWLARGLAAMPAREVASPFRAVSLGPALPRALRGDVGAVAMNSVADFDVKEAPVVMGGAGARQGFESLYEQGVRDLLYGTGRETFDAVQMLKAAAPHRLAPAHGAVYPRGRLGESLRQIAQLIRADVGLEVAFADVGGWDTHAGQGNERGQLAFRLKDFAAGLAALDRDLGPRMSDVVVLTMSEFGRTVRENGNRGTDHGHATAMLVLGGPVKGGRVYGRWPGLRREQLYEGRDLAVTTDFRSLFTEVAVKHLGAPPEPLFPAFTSKPSAYPGVLA
ncbi:MAG TPA: DUF1501 domain-containing protein [Methylomirabilota bacterium]|jgi:uncharacterized protein (DUF1501 family)|nr:DUF1501 domain-containing protein [Methylomirabilota bacterium]